MITEQDFKARWKRGTELKTGEWPDKINTDQLWKKKKFVCISAHMGKIPKEILTVVSTEKWNLGLGKTLIFYFI